MKPFARRGAGPALPMPEFMPVVPRGARLAVLWAWTAGACCIVSGIDAAEAWQRRAEAQEQLRAAQLLPARPRSVRPASQRTPPGSQAATAAATAARATEAALQHPWDRIFTAVDTASAPGLHWLHLEHADRATLRLEGQATDTTAALAASDRLRRQGEWRNVVLSRMSPRGSENDPDTAIQAVQFELTARWVGARP